jgi:hypothetical protein
VFLFVGQIIPEKLLDWGLTMQGDRSRLRRVVHKLMQGEPITTGALGDGSIRCPRISILCQFYINEFTGLKWRMTEE